MKPWRFLKYERSYILLCAATFCLVLLIWYAEPGSRLHAESLAYAAVLQLLLMAAFFGYRYARNVRAIRMMRHEDVEPLSLEAEAYQQALQDMERSHMLAQNEVHAKQKEYYDFIVSWFHEVKTPISVIRLMQQTEVEPEKPRGAGHPDRTIRRPSALLRQARQLQPRLRPRQLRPRAARQGRRQKLLQSVHREKNPLGAGRRPHRRAKRYQMAALHRQPAAHEQPEVHARERRGRHRGARGRQGEAARHPRQRDRHRARDLPRIFNRGFTGTNGRIHMKSTGMGLYLAQELSKKLGHYITCVWNRAGSRR